MLEYYPNLFELQFLLCFVLGYGTHTTPQQYASKPWKDLPSTLCLPRVGSGGDFQVLSHRCSELYQSGFCLCLDYSDRCLIPEYGLSDSFDFIHLRPQVRLDQYPPQALGFQFRSSFLLLTRKGLGIMADSSDIVTAFYQPGSHPSLKVLCNVLQC